MNTPRYSLMSLATLTAALTLSGCGTGFVNAVTNTPPSTVTSPVTPQADGLGGVNMGGHAPLVGAHIYMVQLGAPSGQVASGITQTYGTVVKSLLTQDGKYTSTPVYSGTPAMPYMYPRTQNGSWTNSGHASDQFVPSTDLVGQPFYGVTTNQYGEFNITGDYTCNAGYPVMLIGYGGSPSYYGAGPNTFNVLSAVIYKGTVGGVAGGIITYQTTTQLFYTSESISTTITGTNSYFSVTTGSTATAFTGASGATSGVLSGNEISGYTGPGSPALTSTQFSVFIPGYTGGTGNPGTVTGTVTGTPAFNPAAVNLAMLGLCPASGNFSTSGNGALNYIYMNEVSTTAAGYALAQFTNQLATGQSGYDEFHIGAPVGNLAGLQNAAITAGLLYDIQGSNIGTGTFDGENHTARTVTPGTATGAVPNQQINMIANALAACVDSANTYYWSGTYVAPTTNQSTACKTLGQYAEDNGYLDTSAPTHYAFNIAQAAFSLARFPQGLGTATTSGGTNGGTQTLTAGTATTASNFVSAIFNLPAGSNTPFLPQVTAAPNDLSIPIQWNPDGSTAVTDVEIDGNGIAYAMGGAATNAGTGSTKLFAFAPSTVTTGATLGGMNLVNYTAASGLSTALTSGLAIDASNNVWVPGLTGVYKFTPGTAAGAQVGGGNSASGGAIALDSSVNQYIPSGNDGNPLGLATSITKQNTAATVAGGYPIASTSTQCANSVGWTTLDSAGNVWTSTSQNNTNAGATVNYVCRFANSGGTTPQYTFALPNNQTGQAGASSAVGGFSIARGLATDMGDNAWFAEKNQDALYVVAKGTTSTGTYAAINTLHGRLSAPRGVAVDGANTIWVSSTGDTTATVAGGVSSPKYGTGLIQFNTSDVAITPNYITGATTASSASSNTSLASVAIDPSGNVWSAQGSQTPSLLAATVNPTLVYEYVGLAAPTTTPIVVAKANKTTGVKAGLGSSTSTSDQVLGNIAYFVGTNNFYVGETVLLSGFTTNTFYNGQTIMLTGANGGGFYGPFIHASTGGVVTETGLVTALN